MKANNYNNIAWCYDVLSSIIFGKAIKKAQTEMLNFIPADCRILIAGGGTGWILEKIAKVHQSGLRITYVDPSEKMIEKSKKRRTGLNKIEFICKPVEQVLLKTNRYDVIVTSFFFDNFPQAKCEKIFLQLHDILKSNGLWLFTDFRLSDTKKYWQNFLLKFMYFFFKVVCRLEARHLPDIRICFQNFNYEKISGKTYYRDFITASAFKKK